MITVDTRGQLCPAPLIAAKRALKESADGDMIMILTDNKTSYNNLLRFLRDNKVEVVSTEKDGTWELSVRRDKSFSEKKKAEEYCTTDVAHFEKGDFIIVISSDRMGEGDEKLGKLLISNFIKAIKDLDKLPDKIIFYNSGVNLAVRGSENVHHLKQLEDMGVQIYLCATCLDYYELSGNTGAGVVSNMYSIAEAMVSASKIIKP